MSAPGSEDRPWKSLAEIVKSGTLKTLKPGDTLLLRSGFHGSIVIEGNNSDVITIAAQKRNKPQLSHLIVKGKKWTFRGLTISPTFDKSYKAAGRELGIVELAEGSPSSDITIEDCFIYNTLNSSSWGSREWMAAGNGIWQGGDGTNITLRNNYILNVRFGIQCCSYNSVCEGNVISDFSADGIRVTRDGEVVQYNVIKNVYVNAKDGDKNHDDGIQCFLYNVGTGTVKNIVTRGNVIINRENPAQKYTNTLQGIGYFDGPLVNFVAEDNVVLVDMWHGVSLYDAQNCTITGNSCYSIWTGKSNLRPWVQLGGKAGAARGNTVKNNQAMSFDLKADKSVKAENNTIVTAKSFAKALEKAMADINGKFGAIHELSGKKRFEKIDIR